MERENINLADNCIEPRDYLREPYWMPSSGEVGIYIAAGISPAFHVSVLTSCSWLGLLFFLFIPLHFTQLNSYQSKCNIQQSHLVLLLA